MVAAAAVLSTVVAGGEGSRSSQCSSVVGESTQRSCTPKKAGTSPVPSLPYLERGGSRPPRGREGRHPRGEDAVPRASPGDAVPRVKMGHASVATPTSERKRGETTPLPTRKTRGGRAGASARHALCCRTAPATLPRRDKEEGIESGKSETIHAHREGKREGKRKRKIEREGIVYMRILGVYCI